MLLFKIHEKVELLGVTTPKVEELHTTARAAGGFVLIKSRLFFAPVLFSVFAWTTFLFLVGKLLTPCFPARDSFPVLANIPRRLRPWIDFLTHGVHVSLTAPT